MKAHQLEHAGRARGIGIALDPRREEPLYQQIFDQVVTRIRSHAFPPGFRLPPTRILARELSTHRNTVVRAYADLEAAGFVSSVVGRGTFVEASARSAVGSGARGAGGAAGGGANGGGAGVGTAVGTSGGGTSGEPPSRMPWSTLLSRAANADGLGKAARFARSVPGDVVNLARMQPSKDLLPDQLLRRCIDHALRDLGTGALEYAPPEGLARLRRQIVQDLAEQGVPAGADDVLVTTGSQQALDLIIRTLVNPNDAFLVDSTTYSGAIDLFTLGGARLIPVPSDAEGPDLAALSRLSRPGVKGFYLMPNCNNPTGLTVSEERRRGLVAWSKSAGIPLIEDDYGASLDLDGTPPPAALRTLDGDVVYFSTFSKRLVPALRIGFIIAPPALRPILTAMKRAMDLATSTVLQHGLAEFMERGYLKAHMNRTLPEYRARRDALEAGLVEHLPAGMRWTRPSRGVVLWLPLPPALDPEMVFEEALRRGVRISPSTLWSVDAGAERGLRLTFCAEPVERIFEGARRLGQTLKALLGERAANGGPAAFEVV
jgi:DNA-binding transcriptional MocR family regulator